ncbi:restriction endonuclease subunit S [Algoriphagus vanfongensis]|uniref:restriction endonuclease subunit S n=1 Tax=Algoriphagus vanfongensis TaxID=426371 RepID=UPI000408B7E4|nr:restriction endonuclease subunit S [Algoriphagus vanfongensis]
MKEGWEIKKLGEVCDFQNGFAFKSKTYKESGLPILRITNIQNQELELSSLVYFDPKDYKENFDRFKVFQNDLVIAMSGATTGKLGINTSGTVFYLNQRVGKFLPRKNLLRSYLYYFLSTKVEESLRIAAGAAQPNLSTEQINNFEIPFPPLPEQQRIVSILDECFAAIDQAKANAEQNLKNAKELFESYLQGVFEKKDEGWEEKTLGEIGKPSMCKRILKHQTSPKGDIPFYKIGTFGKTPDAFISIEIYNEYRTKYSFPKKGDILISASGTIGRRVRYDGEPAFFQDSNIVWIDNDEKQVLNDYLYTFYEFCDWQPSKGATISRLYNSNLTSIKIVFPKTFEEQKIIIEKLDALRAETQKLEAIYQQKLADLEELKKSILQKAFSGELTENLLFHES